MRVSGASLVWFRQDLRLEDNPALEAGVARGGPVVPLFIWAPEEERAWSPGSASRWWLHYSLASLDAALRQRGSKLVIGRGRSLDVLRQVLRETRADAVLWNRRYEPAAIARDAQVSEGLQADGAQVETFNSGLLFEPGEVMTQQGRPYEVFSAFWRTCRKLPDPPEPLSSPPRIRSARKLPAGVPLERLDLLPKQDWAGGIAAVWSPGEPAAAAEMNRFLDEGLTDYPDERDRPGVPGTSRLSPHLHFGEIGPRQVWHAVQARVRECSGKARADLAAAGEVFLRELGWREFAFHLLYHFPRTLDRPLRTAFERFPWRNHTSHLRAWCRGRTGYPLVDAGMRELWTTGWMHNRVRMVAASFLVKDLLIPWQEGAKWFWDTLVDADLANNTLGWQWTAGCGADAAPFFRIFNPAAQGERFDPSGEYVRRWVPELKRLPDRWLHRPWEAPSSALSDAGVKPGKTYPTPIVEHGAAREQALAAFRALRPQGP